MTHALGFLGGPALDYGTRLSRLRWRRAIGGAVAELDAGSTASDALDGSDLWFIVRDSSALPLWRGSEDVRPSAGRVLVGSSRVGSAPLAIHTLRELESARVEVSTGPAGDAALLAFRISEFPPRPGETVEGFVSRLLGDESAHERSDRFAALPFDEPSQRPRPEILAALPDSASRLLDIGCGAAGTSAAIRTRNPQAAVTGIERDGALAAIARGRVARVLQRDAIAALEELARAGEKFDAFVFADVLEHLEDPVRALALARQLAAPGAVLVATVPNVGHLSVVRDLLTGRFDPLPSGLLDAGHLRWFTRATLEEFLAEAGWEAFSLQSVPSAASPCAAEFLSHFSSWGGFDRESLGTYQWLARARPAAGSIG